MERPTPRVNDYEVFVKVSGTKSGPYAVKSTDTMLSLKEQFSKKEGVPIQQIRFLGKYSDDTKTFADLGWNANLDRAVSANVRFGGRRKTKKIRKTRKLRKTRHRKF